MSRQVESPGGTSSVALAASIGPAGGSWELISVTVNFDTQPTTSELLTLTLNSNLGADYDTLLRSTNPSTATVGLEFEWVLNERFASGDKVDLAFTNTDTRDIFWSARYDSSPNE